MEGGILPLPSSTPHRKLKFGMQAYFAKHSWCLEGVWKVSGGCLDGVWMVSGWCPNGGWKVSGPKFFWKNIFWTQNFLGPQIFWGGKKNFAPPPKKNFDQNFFDQNFIICHSLFVTRYLSLVICYLLFVTRYLLLYIFYS